MPRKQKPTPARRRAVEVAPAIQDPRVEAGVDELRGAVRELHRLASDAHEEIQALVSSVATGFQRGDADTMPHVPVLLAMTRQRMDQLLYDVWARAEEVGVAWSRLDDPRVRERVRLSYRWKLRDGAKQEAGHV